jgi:competence protein CoiA
MQLYALEDTAPIFADRAEKQKDYTCPECGLIVRLRGGDHRQNHFYHLKEERPCRQKGKSMAHLQAQLFIQRNLGAALEVRFPEIQRIADVVWEEHKIIFEIQCSPISGAEIMRRNEDYKKIGYEVVWILHDKRFNQTRHSAAEYVLKEHSHYFTNFDAQGNGGFYDQFDVIRGARRLEKLRPLRISLEKPYPNPTLRKGWRWGFAGDLSHTLPTNYAHSMQVLIKKYQVQPTPLWKYLLRPLQILFDYFLEKACR